MNSELRIDSILPTRSLPPVEALVGEDDNVARDARVLPDEVLEPRKIVEKVMAVLVHCFVIPEVNFSATDIQAEGRRWIVKPDGLKADEIHASGYFSWRRVVRDPTSSSLERKTGWRAASSSRTSFRSGIINSPREHGVVYKKIFFGGVLTRMA